MIMITKFQYQRQQPWQCLSTNFDHNVLRLLCSSFLLQLQVDLGTEAVTLFANIGPRIHVQGLTVHDRYIYIQEQCQEGVELVFVSTLECYWTKYLIGQTSGGNKLKSYILR